MTIHVCPKGLLAFPYCNRRGPENEVIQCTVFVTHPYVCLLGHWGVAVEVDHFWSSVHGSGIALDLREGAP